MKTIEVLAKKPYSVKIGPELLELAGSEMQKLQLDGKVMVVSDDNVAPLYLEKVKASLEKSGFGVSSFILPHGEESKNTEQLIKLLNFTASHGFSRSDTLLALGGGVVGDLCGFAAAVYMRGINFIQLPTTLLAAVDSSVGGKTAVDLDEGKNLAGAFYQPKLVLCDTDTFRTLPPEEFSNGMSEVIKYGMICDKELLDALAEESVDIEQVVAQCVAIKARIVAADEFDFGERMLLNFGHTIAHAIELSSGYTVPHGRAVACGMAEITAACVKNGSCSKDALKTLLELLKKYNLPDSHSYTAEEIYNAALKDKKNAHGKITLILPVKKGKCVLQTTNHSEMKKLLNQVSGDKL